MNREGRQGRKESWLGVAWRPSRSLRQSLPGCGWSLKLSWDNPQNVVLHFYAYSREFSFNLLFELRDGRRAVLAVEAARIVHQDHVLEAGICQDGFQFACEPLLVALEAGPSVIAGIQPEERRLFQGLQQFRHNLLAITFMNMHVRRAGKLFCGALRQSRIKLHGMDFRKTVFHG